MKKCLELSKVTRFIKNNENFDFFNLFLAFNVISSKSKFQKPEKISSISVNFSANSQLTFVISLNFPSFPFYNFSVDLK